VQHRGRLKESRRLSETRSFVDFSVLNSERTARKNSSLNYLADAQKERKRKRSKAGKLTCSMEHEVSVLTKIFSVRGGWSAQEGTVKNRVPLWP